MSHDHPGDPWGRLEHLEHRERWATARWESLVERLAFFPNAVSERQEREARADLDALRAQISTLRNERERRSAPSPHVA